MKEQLEQYVEELVRAIPLSNEQIKFIYLILSKFQETGIENYDQLLMKDHMEAIRQVVKVSFPLQ